MANRKIPQDVLDICLGDEPIEALKVYKKSELKRLELKKFQFFEPNGKCEQYIQKVGSGDYFVVLFSAANGVGKTAASTNIVAHLIWGKGSENQYFQGRLYKEFPYPKRGRIITDPTNVAKNLIPTLKEWFPAGRYKTGKGGKQYESTWTTDNGWEFDIMTYEQDVKEFEAATLGWAWFDEPPPENIFKATVARMRKGGVIFISATPLKGSAWMYDHIIANPDQDLASSGQRVYVEADVEDACKQHGVRGHLEHDHIQRMLSEYDENDMQARAHGKFQHLIGIRFKTFSRNIHVIKPFEITRRGYCVYHALDTHPRVNDMGTWIAVDGQGRKFICNELWVRCLNGSEELAQHIKDKNSQYRVVRMLLEPAAFIEDQHTEKSLATKLTEYGLGYIEASKMREASDKRIDDALAFTKITLPQQGDEFIKAPELYIFDTCIRHILEFEHYSWDDWTGKSAERHDLREKTIDKDDHAIENIGRILIQEPVFIPIQRIEDDSGGLRLDPYD